jgi:hypothetical protein
MAYWSIGLFPITPTPLRSKALSPFLIWVVRPREFLPQLSALITPAIKRPIGVNRTPRVAVQIPAFSATPLAIHAIGLFFSGKAFGVVGVVFSEERAVRPFVETGLTVG